MIYENIFPAIFIDRPNRFIADIMLNGEKTVCHVKNTGRCRELLTPGANIFVQMAQSPERKTKCDLISVRKGDRLINTDAQAPNKVFAEWLTAGGMGFVPDIVKPEYVRGDSRFDFYFEHGGKKALAEIKGVTLEDNGIVRFPDAPTERGVKHLRGLKKSVGEGYEAYAVFIIQMSGVKYFEPNRKTHPEFADALREAADGGVRLIALDCQVTDKSLTAGGLVDIIL